MPACKPKTAGQAPRGDASTTTKDAAVASAEMAKLDGAALYGSLCAVCHGDDGTGYKADHAPSLVNPTFLESATDDYLRRSIVAGRPGTSMGPYGKERGGPLDFGAVGRVVAWIRGHGPEAGPLPASTTLAGSGGSGGSGSGGSGSGGSGSGSGGSGSGSGSSSGVIRVERRARHAALRDPLRALPRHPGVMRATAVHLANAAFLDVASDAFLRSAIAEGRPGTPMEAWKAKLTVAEIERHRRVHPLAGSEAAAARDASPADRRGAPRHSSAGERAEFHRARRPLPAGQRREVHAGSPASSRFDQVKKALDEGKKLIIIRRARPLGLMRVNITGGVSIRYHALKRLEEMPNDGTWVIAYCACPHHLSGEVVDALRKRGGMHAVVLDEGILEWHPARRYPVVAAPGVEAPPKEAPRV